MRDEPLRKCPKCSKAALKRLVGGGAGVIFKGSGFYVNDYAKKGPRSGAAESKAAPEAKPGGGSKPGGSPGGGTPGGAQASADPSRK